MAKSIRSKWKRKMRAIKRTKNSTRELDRLKKVVSGIQLMDEVTMKEIATVKDVTGGTATVITAEESQDEVQSTGAATAANMDVDKPQRKYNRKTLMDTNGQFPIWMNHRQIRKQRAKNKVLKRKSKAKK